MPSTAGVRRRVVLVPLLVVALAMIGVIAVRAGARPAPEPDGQAADGCTPWESWSITSGGVAHADGFYRICPDRAETDPLDQVLEREVQVHGRVWDDNCDGRAGRVLLRGLIHKADYDYLAPWKTYPTERKCNSGPEPFQSTVRHLDGNLGVYLCVSAANGSGESDRRCIVRPKADDAERTPDNAATCSSWLRFKVSDGKLTRPHGDEEPVWDQVAVAAGRFSRDCVNIDRLQVVGQLREDTCRSAAKAEVKFLRGWPQGDEEDSFKARACESVEIIGQGPSGADLRIKVNGREDIYKY